MSIVSSDFLQGVLTNYRALFAREFSAAQALQGWQQLTIKMDSDGATNEYTWFGTVPRMEDVSSDQVSLRGLEAYDFSIRNRPYQAAIEVDREAFERDQLNLITPRIQQLAGEAARHPGNLIFDLFEGNPDAFDDTAFFATTRTIGDSDNIDNLLNGNGVTVADIQADLATARTTMRQYQDDRGRPLNSVGNVIVIPAELEQPMWQALNVGAAGLQDRQVIPSTANGILNASGYTIIVNPYLTDVDDWYLLHVGGPAMRPFVWQEEKKPVLESDTNPNSRENILKRKYVYSVYGRYAVGVTDPRLAVKTVN